MKEQKIVITKDQTEINTLLSQGWVVTSITAQHVSVSNATSGNDSYSTMKIYGSFCFLLEKDKVA